MNFSGKTALVTGASHGLGLEVARLLSSAGVRVFALARSIEKANLPETVIKVPMNIRDLTSIDEAFAAIDSQTKTIDILVNCAGRMLLRPLEMTTREEIMNILGVNLKGNIYIAQEAYRRMLPQKSGFIVNVLSTTGLRGRENETIYAASKWGLRGFTESLRLEAKPHGILVSSVYPGGMQSETFWQDFPKKDISKYMKSSHVAEQIVHLLSVDSSMHCAELVIERN